MKHSWTRYAFALTLMVIMAFLVGCFDNSRLAPVVNAWYQTRASENTYRVQPGDTIYSIAWAFGLDYRALAQVNHLRSPYEIVVGQRLRMTNIPHGFYQNNRSIKPIMEKPKLSGSKNTILPKIRHYSNNHAPLRWRFPTQGRLVERFDPNVIGRQGIALTGRFGQPVYAAAAGEVVYSGDGVRGYGNLVIIKHNDHYLSAYAFNERNMVRVGDIVQTGSLIARMGRNNAGQILLYFEIRRDGKPVDPLQFLQ